MVKFEQKKFASELPAFFNSILEDLKKEGFISTLVGGAVRDFFLLDSPGLDWDIELTHETLAFNKSQWKELGKNFGKYGRVTFLPYDIIRLEAGDFQIEFSPPRIEHYIENSQDHSNFTAEFNFKLPFPEAVKRRDFTINAMGIRFTDAKRMDLIDPLNGLLHLREKTLHYAGPDFGKDPVRYLRAMRFRNRLGFTFTPELKSVLDQMNLGALTPAYIWSEMQKSGDPIHFLSVLLSEKEKHPELKLPVDERFKNKIAELRKVLQDPARHEAWMIALEWVGLSSEEWSSFFSLSSETSRRMARWAASSREFGHLMPESFHGEFEEVREKPDFEKIFDWYFTTRHLLQKNPQLPLLKMIEEYLPAWIHLFRFEPPKDVKHIDPPFRAKYQVWNLCQRL